MKRKLLTAILAVVCIFALALGFSACGDENSGSDTPTEVLEYRLNYDTSYGVSSIGTATDTDIVIPATCQGKPVTYIGNGAFANCSSITSINFGGTVEQWKIIEKDSLWDDETGEYVVHCTDGDIDKQGNVTMK